MADDSNHREPLPREVDAREATVMPAEERERFGFGDVYIDPELIHQPVEDGFNIRTIIAAVFIGFVMIPGAIYMGLIGGFSLGPAAEWVTIILFAEAARRSLKPLRRQEIYTIYFVAFTLTVFVAVALPGGPFSALIWNQFLVTSNWAEAMGVRDQFPAWFSPAADSEAIAQRTFFHADWIKPILFVVFSTLVLKINQLGLGYAAFRFTSSVEKLPFPLAAVSAHGVTALAESGEKRESWRWRVFSIGAVIGLVWGALYIGVPAITGALFNKPLVLIPIPWIDLTRTTEHLLPSMMFGFMTDMFFIFLGFVLPFWVIIGSFAGSLITMLANPLLYHAGVVESWQPGMEGLRTYIMTKIDVWISIQIGTMLAVLTLGIFEIVRLRRRKSGQSKAAINGEALRKVDWRPFLLAVAFWLISSLAIVVFWRMFIPSFPTWIVCVLVLVVVPAMAYADTRMFGIAGQPVQIPFLKESLLVIGAKISGYRGVDIWLAPLAVPNYGQFAQRFKECEITRTRVFSIIKADLLCLPIILVASFIFWSLIWKMNPIPSSMFPYAEKYWDLYAFDTMLWIQSTAAGGESILFDKAIKPEIIATGFGAGVIIYFLLSLFGLPIAMVYGLIRSVGALPFGHMTEMVGAMIGRYYFRKKFGPDWHKYTPILAAGFACGMGLIGMASVAIALIKSSITPEGF